MKEYKFFELSESNRDFINKVIQEKKNDKTFILDDIQRFEFTLAINNGIMEQKITHSQETYNYSKSYWVTTQWAFEGKVLVEVKDKWVF